MFRFGINAGTTTRSEPQSGDRVPYILLDTGDPKAKAYEKAEDPKYAKEHNLKVDYNYYFINKFLNPVCDLIEPLFEDPKEEIFGELLTRVKPKRRPKKRLRPILKGNKKLVICSKHLKIITYILICHVKGLIV